MEGIKKIKMLVIKKRLSREVTKLKLKRKLKKIILETSLKNPRYSICRIIKHREIISRHFSQYKSNIFKQTKLLKRSWFRNKKICRSIIKQNNKNLPKNKLNRNLILEQKTYFSQLKKSPNRFLIICQKENN